MTIHRRFLTGLLLAFMATSVWAQSWPTRPVRMIIAFPPGGPTDLVSRVLAQRLSEQLGQQVIVDNKPGAGGNLAAELAARATPDGYTIFYNTSAIVIGPALYGKVNYDTLKDFAPVALTASVPMVLVVNPQLPARSVKEFLDLAKSRPGALNYSSSGTGTITHLASAMMSSQTGVQTQHIPYKGSAPGLVDLAAGQTQFMIDTINTVLPYVRDNRLRGLAVGAWRDLTSHELRELKEAAFKPAAQRARRNERGQSKPVAAAKKVVAPVGKPVKPRQSTQSLDIARPKRAGRPPAARPQRGSRSR
jgi:tripartite-type tricarboxylate transporter receptor subunit TctC